jgi:1-acyl-sn-glycerol-3-phosphate acyltransferase
MDVFKSIIVWLIGVLYAVLLFPVTLVIWLLTLTFDRDRTITHRILTLQSFMLVWLLPIWKVRVEGRGKALKDTAYVIISNHQSILDILLVNCLRYRFKWVSKIENLKMPLLGWYLRMADYIIINRGNQESKEEMMERSLQYLKRGTSIMMFPEGTRSADREIGFFKRGAFQLAIQAGRPILPILLDGSGGVLPKHGLIFSTGHEIRIKVFDPVPPEAFNTNDPDILSLKFSTFMTEALKELRTGKP